MRHAVPESAHPDRHGEWVGADVNSSYHLQSTVLEGRSCAGTACFVARHRNPQRWLHATAPGPRVYCLGKCYASPSATDTTSRPEFGVHASRAVTLGRILTGGARRISDYLDAGGYRGLRTALALPRDAVVQQIEVSGLRGRGGAGFPTGRKMRAVASRRSPLAYVVINADEGDPGAYIDRILLEDDPHSVLEGLLIAAYATGATRGAVYLRREYPDALPVVRAAIDDAREAGLFSGVATHGAVFDVDVVVGAGSYVCGEETALLNALEGHRPFTRSRPPYPSDRGVFGQPTLVQNVETLANLPWILEHGGEAYAAMGVQHSRGTKLISLNSLFTRPGLYEVEFGTPVRTIVEELGGGLGTGTLRGVMIGGPLAGVLPVDLLDTPLAFDQLRALGCSVGHGGMMAFDEHTPVLDLVHHVFSFGAYESCGRCTPCRLGARHLERMSAVADAQVPWDMSTFEEFTEALRTTSLCGHGAGLADFAGSVLRYFGEELRGCLASS